MESAIRLCYCPLPRTPLRLSYVSKGSENAIRPSIFHLRFNHATLCLSQSSTSNPIARSSMHANCMLDDSFSVSSKHEGSDNKILRGMSGASLVLACVLGFLNFNSTMNPKLNTAYAIPLPFHSSTTLHSNFDAGGEVTLESLLKMINAEHSNQPRPQFKHEPDETEVEALKLYAVGLSKSGGKGEEKKALEIVEKAYNKYKNSQAEYSLRTALLQLLIFQGKIEEARKRLDSKIDEELEGYSPKKLKYEEKIDKLVECYNEKPTFYEKRSIAQLLLYKAIIHTMLKHKEAAKWGKAFTKITENEI